MFDPSSLSLFWSRVCARLRPEIGELSFEKYLRPLIIRAGGDQSSVVMICPSAEVLSWIRDNYLIRIKTLLAHENPEVSSVHLELSASHDPTIPSFIRSQFSQKVANVSDSTSSSDFGAFSYQLNPQYTFSQFIPAKSNELAFSAARNVADSDTISFNPLIFFGGVGLGKTHLMHAIAWRLKERCASRMVLYLSAETFMYQFVRALRFKDMVSFKERLRSVDVLMVDDVQFIAGKESTQEEFFHTFNALMDRKCQIVISADRSPAEMSGIDSRMRSRLSSGMMAEIHPTTYELRLGILQSKIEALQLQVELGVLEFLAERVTSNVRELEGALIRLSEYSKLFHRCTISLSMVQEVLHDLLRSSSKTPSISDIQKRTADHYGIDLKDLLSASRIRAFSRPRQIAIYLAKKLTMVSLPELGKQFGGRDHTTILYAVKSVEDLRKADLLFSKEVDLLYRSLGGR